MNPQEPEKVDVGIVVVDVANVCRDHSLPGGVGLGRLERILEAWRSQICEHAEVHLVMDKSVLADLGKEERLRVKRLRRRRELWVRRTGADDLLLDLAEEKGGCVLSRDRFLDKRRARRWVEERFYAWKVEDGELRICRRPPRNTQPYDISRREEQKLARLRGLTDPGHPVARRRWACVSEARCETRNASPALLKVLPVLERDRALCPGCGHPLEDRGPRRPEAELKLVVEDTELSRFSLVEGETVAFGRTAMPHSPRLSALGLEGGLSDVGRVHAHLRLSGKRLAVRPVDDEHAVWVRQWDSRLRRVGKKRELRHRDGFARIGIRDTLLLGDQLELHRSGRSIAEAESLGETGGEGPWRAWRTAR